MACIIKIPSKNSKGVVTFTTQERDKFILPNEDLQKNILSLKNRWVIGLHHNWHDFNFLYNPLFDFSMAGETDLIEKDEKSIPLIPMDACNFSPNEFHFSNNDKFWDILYVARAVYFKKIPEFFQIIRKLYDAGKMYRVLLISPIPQECHTDPNSETGFCNIREMYDEMFSQAEQDLFTLLTIDYRSPFPFDIPTVAHFYRSSKIFVHSADDEKRCRVAGYAWATGMPVVCMDAVASLLPQAKQIKPYIYLAKDYDDFTTLIDEAIYFVDSYQYNSESMRGAIEETSEIYTKDSLKKELAKYHSKTQTYESDTLFNLKNLDLRLGRHFGFGDGVNSIAWSIDSLVRYLHSQSEELLREDIRQYDFERYITKYALFGKLERNNLYVEKYKFDLNIIKHFLLRKFSSLRMCSKGNNNDK